MKKSEVAGNLQVGFPKRREKLEAKEMKGENENEGEKKRKKKTRKGKEKGKKDREEDLEELREPSEEKFEALAIVPPDGGWGWVVVFCSFIILMCSDGSINSYGVFSFHIEEEFNVTVGETSSIAAVAACLYYVCGMFSFVITTAPPGPVWGAMGNRYGFRSILISGAAFMFAGNLSAYFIKNRFIPFAVLYAIGIGMGGGMVCMSVYVMVGVYFERWRGYATSIISCGSSVGTVFMPPAYSSVEVYGWRYVLLLNSCLMAGCMFLGIFIRPLKPTLVTASLRPEPKQVQFKERVVKEKKVKGKLVAQTQMPKDVAPTSSFVTLKGVGIAPSTTSVYISTQEGRIPTTPPTEEELDDSGARPMYRDDIFYPASSARLGSQTMYRTSAFSVMRLPTVQDLREKEGKPPCQCCPCCPRCPPGVRGALATLLDTSLLRSPVFIGITLSQTISILGYHAPFLFTYVRAKDAGMKPEHSSWLMPLLGISNTIGRLLCGAIVELPRINALHLTSVSYAIGGLFTIVSCFDIGYRLQFAYVVVYGLMAAAFMSMKSIILVEYLGIERLTNAFGLLLMFQGLAALCGPPLAGFIADVTHSYDYAFYCAGSIAVVGGLSGFLVIPLKKYEIKKGMRDR